MDAGATMTAHFLALSAGSRLGLCEKDSALDLAEQNAKAKSYGNPTVWRFPRRRSRP
jgi:hypothetical protein